MPSASESTLRDQPLPRSLTSVVAARWIHPGCTAREKAAWRSGFMKVNRSIGSTLLMPLPQSDAIIAWWVGASALPIDERHGAPHPRPRGGLSEPPMGEAKLEDHVKALIPAKEGKGRGHGLVGGGERGPGRLGHVRHRKVRLANEEPSGPGHGAPLDLKKRRRVQHPSPHGPPLHHHLHRRVGMGRRMSIWTRAV